MKHFFIVFLLAIFICNISGCGGDEPAPSSSPGTDGQAEARSSSTEPKQSRLTISNQTRAFLLAGKDLGKISQDITEALESVTDNETSNAAAGRLAELVPHLEQAMQKATTALLAVERSNTAKQELLRMSIQRTDDDVEFTNQVREELGLEDPKDENVDLIDVMVRTVKKPISGPLRNELVKLRDVFLRGRAPAMPVVIRRRVEQKLGPIGSPLKTTG
jgi:hypothetical protein